MENGELADNGNGAQWQGMGREQGEILAAGTPSGNQVFLFSKDKGLKPKSHILENFHLGERTGRVPVRSDRPVFGRFSDSILAFSRAISNAEPDRDSGRFTVQPVRPAGPIFLFYRRLYRRPSRRYNIIDGSAVGSNPSTSNPSISYTDGLSGPSV
ncbi:hypothetical protein PIB30_024196 [Stylosanthes scabra]|uniref:Uncharacterized protein n=1 Tax=Stylosanthes scabra TaxID=79078 RepID=A0ABU6Q9E8_9FABA|nr:hypothetical protein [Stylosanthes scabra]